MYGSVGSLEDEGLSSPIKGYSNVSTGAGVVAAQSSGNIEVRLGDYLKEILKSAQITVGE